MKLVLIFMILSYTGYSQIDTNSSICEYRGGYKKMHEVLRANLFYPKLAGKDSISGKCYIKFIVDTLGMPVNIEVQKSLRGDYDTSAMFAVKHLTDWTIAKFKGKKVAIKMSIPINFVPQKK